MKEQKEQLSLLEELQQHDARLQEQENTLKSLPEKLNSVKATLAKLEAQVERERLTLGETEKFRRELEGQLKSDEGSAQKSKNKLQQVKTSKDYMAAQREVESTRKMIGEREEELLKLHEALETNRKLVAAHEKDVADLRAHVATEAATTEAMMAEVRARIAADKAVRDVVAAKVKPDVLKRYATIKMRRGLAVVPVVKGVCQGCHMSIPPQLYNMLQRGTSIETCPQCNRIVYWNELMAEKKLDQGESA